MPEGHDEQRVDEQADDNGGRRQQDVVDEFGELGDPAAARIFRQVGPRQNPDRRRDDNGDGRHGDRAEDRIQEAAGGARRRRILGEHFGRDRAEPLHNQGDEDHGEEEQANYRRKDREPESDDVGGLAARVDGHVAPLFDVGTDQQPLGEGKDREGDHEADEAESNEARGVEVARRLGELVGDGRRDRRRGGQQGGRDVVRVADDEGHGHGLTQRAPQAQHDATDQTDTGIGDDDVAHDLPCRHAHAVGTLAQQDGYRLEHVARNRRNERQHHDREDEAGGEETDAVRRTAEQHADHRDVANGGDEEGLDRRLQEGGEEEETPEAVDNRGNAGEQLDSDANRPAQRLRADFGEED